MSKLTKTQIQYVERRLDRIASGLVRQHFEERNKQLDLLFEEKFKPQLEELAKNAKVVVSKGLFRLTIDDETLAQVRKLEFDWEEALCKHQKDPSRIKLQFDKKRQEIMDRLILGDSKEALKMLQELSEMKVTPES